MEKNQKQRIADLLAGGNRTVNSFSEEYSKGQEYLERELERRNQEFEQRKREIDNFLARTDKLIAGYNREREERERETQRKGDIERLKLERDIRIIELLTDLVRS